MKKRKRRKTSGHAPCVKCRHDRFKTVQKFNGVILAVACRNCGTVRELAKGQKVTHTYAIMEVSASTYQEIRKILEEAGYQLAFEDDGVIDLHGLALKKNETEEPDKNVEPPKFDNVILP